MTARAKAIAAIADELQETLTPGALSELVDELRARGAIGEGAADGWISARDVAQRIPFSAEWVRARAETLGARRVGDGPRPRLLFHWPTVQTRLRESGDLPPVAALVVDRPRKPSRKSWGQGGDLLPIRGERPAA